MKKATNKDLLDLLENETRNLLAFRKVVWAIDDAELANELDEHLFKAFNNFENAKRTVLGAMRKEQNANNEGNC